MTPQEAISQQQPKPSECDVVVVIFWSRMRTPLPSDYKKKDGSLFLSGTAFRYRSGVHPSGPQTPLTRPTNSGFSRKTCVECSMLELTMFTVAL